MHFLVAGLFVKQLPPEFVHEVSSIVSSPLSHLQLFRCIGIASSSHINAASLLAAEWPSR